MNVKELLSLKEKIILVTGGAGKFGKCLVEGLSEADGTVIVASRNLEACQKAAEEFKQMVRDGKIERVNVSDSGEWATYCTKSNPAFCMRFWWQDFGREYLVVDHDNPISKQNYENMKAFFDDE